MTNLLSCALDAHLLIYSLANLLGLGGTTMFFVVCFYNGVCIVQILVFGIYLCLPALCADISVVIFVRVVSLW